MAVYCGDTLAVRQAVGSILNRAFGSCRCVVISNNSGSNALSVVGHCRSSFRKHLG